MSHAFYSPSASGRWLSCTQSLILEKKNPKKQKSNKYAERGTALHECAEDILNTGGHAMFYNDYVVTEKDLEEVVFPYIKYVNDLSGDVRLYEVKSEINDLCYGTADAVVYNSKTETLNVIDLKTGSGVFVKVKDNSQLMIYAIGIVKKMIKLGHKVKDVFIHVAQPPLDNYSFQKFSMSELVKFQKKVIATIEDIEKGKGKYEYSDENCRWCPHNVDCPELNKVSFAAAKDAFKEDTLKHRLDIIPALKVFIKAVEDEATETLKKGSDIEGYSLKPSRPVRKWMEPEEVEKALLVYFEKDEIYKNDLLSPPQIQKLLKQKGVEFNLDIYVEKVSSGVKLTKIKKK